MSRRSNASQVIGFSVSVIIGGHLSGLSLTFRVSTPSSTSMRGRLTKVKPSRHDGRTITVLTANVFLTSSNDNNNVGLGVKTTLGSMLTDRVGTLAKGVGGTDLSFNIRSRSSSSTNNGQASCDFHCSRHLFGSHFRVILKNGISAKTGTAGSMRSFVSGVSLRCHLSRSKAHCVHLFRGGGCRDIFRNRVARANINLILHGGVSHLDRLFVFGGGGG